MIKSHLTGYLSSVSGLTEPAEKWICGGTPITMMMNMEQRHGQKKPVIKKALVDLDGKVFGYFKIMRSEWAIKSEYVYPGAIQYYGPDAVCNSVTKTLVLENS